MVDRYHGTPCPKVYVLDRDLRIRYISPDVKRATSTIAVVSEVKRVLGLE